MSTPTTAALARLLLRRVNALFAPHRRAVYGVGVLLNGRGLVEARCFDGLRLVDRRALETTRQP